MNPIAEHSELLLTAPPALRALALALAIAALALAWRGRGTGRVGEVLAWAGAVAVVVFAALGPVWVSVSGRLDRPRVAVLVDDSRSMGVQEGGSPRASAVGPIVDALSRRGEVDLFHFGGALLPGPAVAFDAPTTDLRAALEGVGERYAGERLAGIVVVTDGIDRGPLRRGWRDDGTIDLPALPGPLTLVQVGRTDQVTDLSVRDVAVGGYAFLRSPFRVTVKLSGPGFEGREVPVSLSRDGRPVAERTATLDERGEGEVEFMVLPREVGRFTYEARVPSWDGDAVPGNDSMTVAVRVVRDRLRVLQVCGAPSLDQKFLRLFLKQDPSVDLVSFFILRTQADLHSGYGQDELSLIEFPYERLFSEDLWTFDLVIFQNFDHAPYFTSRSMELLDNLQRYVVEEGRALVMIGGDRSFDLGDYAGTPLADILPITLGAAEPGVDLAPFVPRATDAGRRHPVTRLVADPVENEAVWAGLPAWDGLNLSLGLAPDAVALLEHPGLTGPDGKPLPALAVRDAGRGRTLALLGDSSWRWVMTEARDGSGNQAYLRFWKSAMRWLVRDPAGEPVQVDTARENYLPGDGVRVVTRVRDAGFQAVAGADVVVGVVGPDGPLPSTTAITDDAGEAVVELQVDRRGPYRVKVLAEGHGAAETVFAVTARDPELEELAADPAFLQAVAAAAEGGQWVEPGGSVAPTLDGEAGRWVEERREVVLWSHPLVALVAGVLASLAWGLRRRGGGR